MWIASTMSQGWTFPEAEYSGWVKWRTGDLSQLVRPRYFPYLYPAGGPKGRRLRVAGRTGVGPRSRATADPLSWLAIVGATRGARSLETDATKWYSDVERGGRKPAWQQGKCRLAQTDENG